MIASRSALGREPPGPYNTHQPDFTQEVVPSPKTDPAIVTFYRWKKQFVRMGVAEVTAAQNLGGGEPEAGCAAKKALAGC